ncbi:MAG: hypothetical protein HC916_21690 [Coleofasciculaceae cyanobacterium SM2_1_6]|nr:hypothetical protein [Coleofasciculaceae cyanobacterium SM2_1_6]
METKPITLYVNPEAARIFETVSIEQRRKIEALLSLKLTQANREKRTLEEIMSEISQTAQERGLTPEILDSILHED